MKFNFKSLKTSVCFVFLITFFKNVFNCGVSKCDKEYANYVMLNSLPSLINPFKQSETLTERRKREEDTELNSSLCDVLLNYQSCLR